MTEPITNLNCENCGYPHFKDLPGDSIDLMVISTTPENADKKGEMRRLPVTIKRCERCGLLRILARDVTEGESLGT